MSAHWASPTRSTHASHRCGRGKMARRRRRERVHAFAPSRHATIPATCITGMSKKEENVLHARMLSAQRLVARGKGKVVGGTQGRDLAQPWLVTRADGAKSLAREGGEDDTRHGMRWREE